MIDLNNIKRAHFVGIGGIGISSIARMFLLKGKKVSGSDMSESEVVRELVKLGAKIKLGHKKENLDPKTDLLIHSIAVPENNPELVKAKKLGIKVLTYPETLGLISKNHYTVAIAGTHGKTTTTAMTAKVFIDAGLKPTAIVGSLLKDEGSNFIAGSSEYFIVEACEYKRSFLNLNPKILAITNIDNDHLDYYKNLKEIQKAFSELAAKIPQDGFLVCNPNDSKIKPILKSAKCQIVDYTKVKDDFKLQFPGKHNKENAKVAFAVGRIIGTAEKKILKSLKNFSGTWRRFDFKGTTKNRTLVYDDYAHHPTEVKATLASFKEKFPTKKLIVIFQPHLFSRTKLLLDDFAKSFKNADEIIVAPIYAAREKIDESINSSMLAEKIKSRSRAFGSLRGKQNGKPVLALENFEKISDYLIDNTGKNDLIITMGAGDIYKVGERLI